MRGVLLLVLLLLVGCDGLPRDAAGALDRISGGELRVGVADHPPWVVLGDGQVRGLEPALIERWAAQLHARIVWRQGSPSELVEALHRRELDVLVAGLTANTPFEPRLALTQPYVDVIDGYGRRQKHVLAVTQGESALLLSLDRFLAEQDEAALRSRVSQAP